ncbi:phosphate acetyltransferase [Helicobacter bizzozeronii]|uniref:phosphate acetyltransferase n=1 Tax=Helicobacter bizzozeronii TaxID=56877 RepID=UPI000CF063C4|nr:phosphate acetyltransferase [Helicobacter bizzozeronii]
MGYGILLHTPKSLEEKAIHYLQDLFKMHGKSVALFAPVGDCENFQAVCGLGVPEVLERLAKQDEGVFTDILEIYQNLVAYHDYVVVVGSCFEPLQSFDSRLLDTIAQHLNLVVVNALLPSPNLAAGVQLAHASFKKAGLLNPLSLLTSDLTLEIPGLVLANLNTQPTKDALESLEQANSTCVSPVCFQHSLLMRAKKDVKTIVLPESQDERILKAAHAILQLGAAKIILLGQPDKVCQDAKKLGLDLKDTPILDPHTSPLTQQLAQTLYTLRQAKGLSLEQAQELIKTPTYFGTMLVYSGHADGMVSGATHTTAETVRPALQTIKLLPGVQIVSSVFFMCLDTQVYVFGDCAINPNPTSAELAQIALTSATTAKSFGFEPRIAMLSYSSGTSGKGPDVDKVAQAVQIARSLDSTLLIDGPLQFDAAIDPKTGSKKMPGSAVAGRANTFIFPDLDAGNIAYKAVQRTAKTLAIGPVLQGLKKPVNDLSRGCLVEDVINTIIMTAIQAQG